MTLRLYESGPMRRVRRVVGTVYAVGPAKLTCWRYELSCGHEVSHRPDRRRVSCWRCGQWLRTQGYAA